MWRFVDSLAIGLHDWILGERFDALRARVVGGVSGRVLEIGAGTGLNFPFYHPDAEVTALEPARPLRAKAAERTGADAGTRAPIALVGGRAEALPFPDASFDAVVATFVLCSVDDLERAIGELRRVLRPGGALHLAEHVASPDRGTARTQRLLQPIWTHAFGGCSLVRHTRADLARAGFDVEELAPVELPLPSIAKAGIIGRAFRR